MLRNSVSATANEKKLRRAGGGAGTIMNSIKSVSKTEKYSHEIIA